jgi:hypothetical protein
MAKSTDRTHALAWLAGLAAAGAAAGAGAFAYAFWVEPLDVRLDRLTVHLDANEGSLPPGGLRILHLSDSHFQGGTRNGRERAKIARIRQLTAGLEYDLLVHTGDFIHFDGGLENALALLDAVPKPRLGSFGVFGNHDYTHYNMVEAVPRMWRSFRAIEQERDELRGPLALAAARATRWLRYVRYVRNTPLDGRRTGSNDVDTLAEALLRRGMTLLHNRAVRLNVPASGLDVVLAGVDDVSEGRPHLGNTLADVPTGLPVILLSHNPDIIGSSQLPRVDLVLAGHTHGGQIVLPLWGAAHTQSAYLTRANVAGHFTEGRTQVYVSRGLGEGIPLRFLAGPQVTLITLVAADPPQASAESIRPYTRFAGQES